MRHCIRFFVFSALLLPSALVAGKPGSAPDEVIARVGDQPITFGQINTMLNSSAVVGVSIPALGTPKRDMVRIALLDKVVSANLLYLDALSKGVDERPDYQRTVIRFENGVLAGLYSQRQLAANTEVSQEEIDSFIAESVKSGSEVTEDARAQIEAAVRKRKAAANRDLLVLRLRNWRNELGVKVHEDRIAPSGDATRSDDTVVAELGDEVITWGEVKSKLVAAGRGVIRRDILAMEEEGRLSAVNAEIDTRLLARRAREAGLDQDPVFLRRAQEYRKTRLINLHRADLARRFEPGEEELAAYFAERKADIMIPEARKVQMVVVRSEAAGRELKEQIESGELTMFQAARDHSIDPGAKHNLGEIGWVKPGEGQPALNQAAFALGPDEIAGPVETPAGWHLLKVTDVREQRFGTLSDPATHKRTRRAYIHDRLDDYVVQLRKDEFDVVVYEDNLVRLAQAEAAMVAQLAEQAKQPGSRTQQRIKELQRVFSQ